jgi:hypothetical protein
VASSLRAAAAALAGSVSVSGDLLCKSEMQCTEVVAKIEEHD